jgi:FtsZ-interacting cell division protein YlmF
MWSRRALRQAGFLDRDEIKATIEGTRAMAKLFKHQDSKDTDTQAQDTQAQDTQAQDTQAQDTQAQDTEAQSRGEQARPYLENTSYPASREDLAASAQQQGADQGMIDLIVLIPDDQYADTDAVIVQIELVDANA